ncbi:hypothetical protein EF72_21390 [Salmonella enterica]|nr:hypothetical protein [Salmonella enterica]
MAQPEAQASKAAPGIMRTVVRTPRIEVMLYKSIERKAGEAGLPTSERYAGKDAGIDITPFLGDGSSVTVSKSCKQISGGFNITFRDKPNSSLAPAENILSDKNIFTFESVYGLIEPMDQIEIRWWNGEGVCPTPMRIKMRGFISDVTRTRMMDSNGKPQRVVIINGQDYGKVLQMYQLLYLTDYPGGKSFLTGANIFDQFGEKAINTITGEQFLQMVVKHAANPILDRLIPKYSPFPREIRVDASAQGVVNNSYMSEQGTLSDLLTGLLDVGHWNELFIESREDGEYLVWRPNPYFDLMSGKMIQPLAPEQYGSDWSMSGSRALPAIVNVTNSKITSIRQTRTDRDVYNFYWCNNRRFDMVDDMTRRMQTMMADGHKTTLEYPNTDVSIYGVRLMEGNTVMGYPDLENMTSGADQAEQDQRGGLMAEWIQYRRNVMILTNRDNAVLEKGVIEMAGGLPKLLAPELMRPGDYLQITEGGLSWLAYVVNLQETFTPLRGFVATVEFERGTGFAERVADPNSPWMDEQRVSPSAPNEGFGIGGRGRLTENLPDPGFVCPNPYAQSRSTTNPTPVSDVPEDWSLESAFKDIMGIDTPSKK